MDALNSAPSNYEMQMIYKLAGIEATVKEFSRRIDEKFERLQAEMTSRHLEMMTSTNKLDASVKSEIQRIDTKVDSRFEENKTKIDALVKWRESMTTKMSMIGVMAFALWAVIGDTIKTFFGGIFKHV